MGAATFYPFGRNGWNSQEQRTLAAQRLRDKLRQLRAEHSDAAIYCVAHSHGGTVLWMALGDPECESIISGAVCMGTPFLQFATEPFYEQRGTFGFSTAIILVVLLIHRFRSTPPLALINDQAILRDIQFLLSFAACVVVSLYSEKLGNIWLKKVKQQHCRMTGCTSPEKFLLIRAFGDGASGLLSGVYFLCWLPTRFTIFIDGILDRKFEKERLSGANTAKGTLKYIGATILLLVVVGGSARLANLPEKTALELGKIVMLVWVTFTFLLPAGWSAALTITKAVFTFITLIVRFVLTALFIGPGIAWDSMLLNIAAEPTPPGEWRLLQLNPFTPEKADRKRWQESLYHSLHARDDVLTTIARWISDQQRREPGLNR